MIFKADEQVKAAEGAIERIEKLRGDATQQNFTQDIVVAGLVDSFVALNTLIDDSKMTEENAEKLLEMLGVLLDTVTEMNTFYKNQTHVKDLIEKVKDLADVTSHQNSNIKELIEVLNKQHEMLMELSSKIGGDSGLSIKEEKKENKIDYRNIIVGILTFVMIVIAYKSWGG